LPRRRAGWLGRLGDLGMAHKRRGQLTVSGEWARHLRPLGRRFFWKQERAAEKVATQRELDARTTAQPSIDSKGNDDGKPDQDR
jgi:hypothetical protein